MGPRPGHGKTEPNLGACVLLKAKPPDGFESGPGGGGGPPGPPGNSSPESTSSTPNTLSKRDGNGSIRGHVITADSNLSSNGGCVLSGDLRCSNVDASSFVKCDRTEVAAVRFKNTGDGEFRWIPEKSGDILNLRTNKEGTTLYYQNSAVKWTALQNQSDPKLKNIKEAGTYTAAFDFNDIEVIDFEWNEDALDYAGLNVYHTPNTVYTGFNAENLEQLMPGSTIESDYLPQEDESINSGTYKSIHASTELSLVAMCVREIQSLKAKVNQLEDERLNSRLTAIEQNEIIDDAVDSSLLSAVADLITRIEALEN